MNLLGTDITENYKFKIPPVNTLNPNVFSCLFQESRRSREGRAAPAIINEFTLTAYSLPALPGSLHCPAQCFFAGCID